MRAIQDVILREIAGESILIPVGETALSIHGMISLSESGRLIWERLQTECSEEMLVGAILGEYEIDEETARQDVEAFLEKLRRLHLLEPDGSEAES